MIAPPKPSIVWKVREGSTTTVGAVGWPVPNGISPMSVSLYVPSAVVSHRCAAAGAAERLDAAELSAIHAETPTASANRAPTNNIQRAGQRAGLEFRENISHLRYGR